MKITLSTLVGITFFFCCYGQNLILNPGFENTTLGTGCYTNQSAASVTSALNNVAAFYGGTSDGIDVGVNSACYAGGANSGAVHIVMAGLSGPNMFESISFELSSPIVMGQSYNITFFAANSNPINPEALNIGISGSPTSFGTSATTIALGSSSSYVQYSGSFTASVSGTYLTIEPNQLGEFWFGLDDFSLTSFSPPCATPPTAICAGVTVSLNGSGTASILDTDLDGGSIDNCGTSGLTFSASQTTFDCSDVAAALPAGDALIITGAYDGPIVGGTPKGVELYVAADIADLSLYGISSANNGTGSTAPTPEFTFPAVSATEGQYIYIAFEAVEFANFFGFAPDYTSGSMSINGDDAIELFYNSAVVDVFGDVNMDGTGQPWEYLDGWAYRNDFVMVNGGTFNSANWSYSGINALDGETSNGTAATPFPLGTFTPMGSGALVTLTVTDGNLNSSQCIATVTVEDIDLPTASAPTPISVECIGDVPAADVTIITDEADNCGIPVVTFVSDVSDGLSCPETITRTYNVLDDHGNSIDLVQTITVDDVTLPTASNPSTINVECIGDVPATDVLVVTDENDNCSVAPIVTWESDVSDGLTCPETITRTYRVTDDCGNFIDVTQLIVVEDVTAPVPDGGLTTVNSNCDVTLNAPTATDNCDGTLNAVADVTFPITTVGTTTVTWTYTDDCGNASTQTQDVVITPVDVTTSLMELTITANNAGQTYQWIDCSDDSEIVGETGQNYTATANGDYAVIVTTGDGCVDTSACVNINIIGIDELISSSLVLYPNPTNGVFNIEFDGEIKSIEVVDMLGRAVSLPIDLAQAKVNASSLEPGKYMVRLRLANNQVLIKEVLIIK